MQKYRKKALVIGALAALGCGGNAVDLGHGPDGQGWSDAPDHEASTPTPDTIYDSDLPVLGFALDGPTLYALVYHAPTFDLVSCPLDRCRSQRTMLYSSPKTSADSDENFITTTTMAVAGDRVFWLNDSDLMACAKAGCTEPQRLSPVYDNDCFVADGDTLYWLDNDQAVQRLKPNTDVPEQVRGPLAGVLAADHLVVSGDYLYVSDPGADPPRIHRVRKDGTGDVELVVEDIAISGLSAVGDSIYYPAKVLSGRIVECVPGNCATGAVTLASDQRWPMQVHATNDEAFWLARARSSSYATNSAIHSCRLPDCAAVEIRVADFPLEYSANPPGTYPYLAVSPEWLVWREARFSEVGASLRRLAR